MNWGAAIRNLTEKVSWLNRKLECHIRNTSSESFNQVQSDWDETDTSSPAFILNKPNFLGSIDLSSLPIYDTKEEASLALGPGQLFRWKQGNIDGQPSIDNSALGITS